LLSVGGAWCDAVSCDILRAHQQGGPSTGTGTHQGQTYSTITSLTRAVAKRFRDEFLTKKALEIYGYLTTIITTTAATPPPPFELTAIFSVKLG